MLFLFNLGILGQFAIEKIISIIQAQYLERGIISSGSEDHHIAVCLLLLGQAILLTIKTLLCIAMYRLWCVNVHERKLDLARLCSSLSRSRGTGKESKSQSQPKRYQIKEQLAGSQTKEPSFIACQLNGMTKCVARGKMITVKEMVVLYGKISMLYVASESDISNMVCLLVAKTAKPDKGKVTSFPFDSERPAKMALVVTVCDTYF